MDTTPGPVPMYRALKFPPQLMSCPQRVSQVQLWEHNCLLHDGTCGTRITCTTGTSITVSTGNCRISMVNKTMGISLCVATGKMTTCGTRTNCTSGASITLFTYRGISMVRRTVWTMGQAKAPRTGMMTTCGTRTTCTPGSSITSYTCNWESQWSDEQSGQCEKTSASRQGSTKKMSSWLIPAMMPSIMGLPNREETHHEV